MIRICVVILFFLSTGCAALSTKPVSDDQISLELSGLFIRPFQPGPTTWLTARVTNDSAGVFDTLKIHVVDIANNVTLYGGDFGYISKGFSSDPNRSWPKDIKELKSGQTAYISVNVGKPVGPEIQMTVKMDGPNGYRAYKKEVMNIEGIVPVNQIPGELSPPKKVPGVRLAI